MTNRPMSGIASFLMATIVLSVSTYSLATTIGEDGLHKQDWFSITFKDVAEDTAE